MVIVSIDIVYYMLLLQYIVDRLDIVVNIFLLILILAKAKLKGWLGEKKKTKKKLFFVVSECSAAELSVLCP